MLTVCSIPLRATVPMVSNFNKKDKVYLDTGFLLAYSLPIYQGGVYSQTARKLMAEMIVNKCELMVSTLSFDELWKIIKQEKDELRNDKKLIRKVNKKIKKFLSINAGLAAYSYADVDS